MGAGKFDTPTLVDLADVGDQVGLDPAFYTHRQRPIDETFPHEPGD